MRIVSCQKSRIFICYYHRYKTRTFCDICLKLHTRKIFNSTSNWSHVQDSREHRVPEFKCIFKAISTRCTIKFRIYDARCIVSKYTKIYKFHTYIHVFNRYTYLAIIIMLNDTRQIRTCIGVFHQGTIWVTFYFATEFGNYNIIYIGCCSYC